MSEQEKTTPILKKRFQKNKMLNNDTIEGAKQRGVFDSFAEIAEQINIQVKRNEEL